MSEVETPPPHSLVKNHRLVASINSNNNVLNNICTFGAWAECRSERISLSSYLDVNSRKDKLRLIKPTSLECIAGYTIDYAVGYRALKKIPKIKLNLFYGYI